jgi:glycosyltransferase involved in cell wall biosynthesis
MRIAQVAPLAEAVPPKLYGGTERVVSWLTEELVALGHQVTLFASGDSVTTAALEACAPQALRLSQSNRDPMLGYGAMLARVADMADEFDVVHFHMDWVHIPLFSRLRVPFISTMHGRLDLPEHAEAFGCFGDAALVSISDAQRTPLPTANWVGTVHHGQPKGLLQPYAWPEGYLAFLGRIAPEKGPEEAIRLARATGRPLKIAAKIGRADHDYFEMAVKPLIDGKDIEFVGEIEEWQKSAFLGNAAALLFPIRWPEPFGLVMIEAMACGTPVIAYRHGSVPEIVEDGVSGFIVDEEPQAAAAIGRIGTLDRRRVREAFERRFTARRMAEDYVQLYGMMARRGSRPILLNASPAKFP